VVIEDARKLTAKTRPPKNGGRRTPRKPLLKAFAGFASSRFISGIIQPHSMGRLPITKGTMFTQTVGDILQGRGMQSGFPCVYIVRDGDKILYVGKTRKSVAERIQQHCAYYSDPSHASQLGKFIQKNIPESYSWVVETLSIKECLISIKEGFPNVETVNYAEAEIGMILICRPYLNIMNNTRGKPLPEIFRSGSQLELF